MNVSSLSEGLKNIEGHVLKTAGLQRNVCGSKRETVLKQVISYLVPKLDHNY
jgi:hypothetical protein